MACWGLELMSLSHWLALENVKESLNILTSKYISTSFMAFPTAGILKSSQVKSRLFIEHV